MRTCRPSVAIGAVLVITACAPLSADHEDAPGLYVAQADVAEGLRGRFVAPDGIELEFASFAEGGLVVLQVTSGDEVVVDSRTGAETRALSFAGIEVGAAMRATDDESAPILSEAARQPRALAVMALAQALGQARLPPFGLVSYATSSLGILTMLLQSLNGELVPGAPVPGRDEEAPDVEDPDELCANRCPGGVVQADGCLDHEPGAYAIHADGTFDEVSDDLDEIEDEPVLRCPTAEPETSGVVYSHGGACNGACGLGCSLCPAGRCCYTSACSDHDECINNCEHFHGVGYKLCHVECAGGLPAAVFSYFEECL